MNFFDSKTRIPDELVQSTSNVTTRAAESGQEHECMLWVGNKKQEKRRKNGRSDGEKSGDDKGVLFRKKIFWVILVL